jgi:hypothetical protein
MLGRIGHRTVPIREVPDVHGHRPNVERPVMGDPCLPEQVGLVCEKLETAWGGVAEVAATRNRPNMCK